MIANKVGAVWFQVLILRLNILHANMHRKVFSSIIRNLHPFVASYSVNLSIGPFFLGA